MTPTHTEVLAAIDKARADDDTVAGYWHNPHCDDLRATAERHKFYPEGTACWACLLLWPCPDYQQVIDRLTAWGVL